MAQIKESLEIKIVEILGKPFYEVSFNGNSGTAETLVDAISAYRAAARESEAFGY